MIVQKLRRNKSNVISYARSVYNSNRKGKYQTNNTKVYISPSDPIAEHAVSDVESDDELAFPMHCVTIQDLLEFEKLPSFDEVANMGKFVVVDSKEERPVVFISHQVPTNPIKSSFKTSRNVLRYRTFFVFFALVD